MAILRPLMYRWYSLWWFERVTNLKNRQIRLTSFTSLLPPNSDRVMIHLGGYNRAICDTQLIEWEYVQEGQL